MLFMRVYMIYIFVFMMVKIRIFIFFVLLLLCCMLFHAREQCTNHFLSRGELRDGLGAFRDGVLGQLAR